MWNDPEFAVKQLVEIALRALSPGVNEPFTALTCIDRLTEGLTYVAGAPIPADRWCDSAGRVRVWVQSQPFSVLVRAAFDPIRLFAGTNPAIYVRLVDSLAELGYRVRNADDRQRLRELADIIRRSAERAIAEAEDLRYVTARHQKAIGQLAGTPASSRR